MGYLKETSGALRGEDGVNPDTGRHFSHYLDVESFIDHMILNTLAMNVNWGRLSAIMYLPRNGKLHAGPVWNEDQRGMGSEDGRDQNPLRWDGSSTSERNLV